MSFTGNLSQYELIITDMDGTLYFQRPVQLLMGMRMAFAALFSKNGRKELSAVLAFRKEREALSEESGFSGASSEETSLPGASSEETSLPGNTSFENILYERTARKVGMSAEEAERAVKKWLYEKPVSTVGFFGDRKLIRILDRCRGNGITVVILSDYPASDKAEALGISTYPEYYSGDPAIGVLKPDPAGILYAMSDNGVTDKEKVLVIGDRDSKDGAAARAAGTDFVILRKSRLGRILKNYHNLR